MTNICPVCGYPSLEEPVIPGGPDTFEICPCCFFEFGVDDLDKGFTYEQWRTQWIAEGMPWRSKSVLKPKNFSPEQQLQNIENDN